MFNYRELLTQQGQIVPKILVLALLIWTAFWKGLALWRSARNSQKYWFVAMLILNTVGILPIIYLAAFQKEGKKKKK